MSFNLYYALVTVTALVSLRPFSASAVNVPVPAATGTTLTLVLDTFVTVNTSSSLEENSMSVVASAGVIVSVTELSVPTVALTVSGKDIAVAGFDNREMSDFLTPPLTTMEIPLEEIGHESAVVLLQKINGKEIDTNDIKIPCRLIERKSV